MNQICPKTFTTPRLLLEFIFPFSMTGYWFNNICLYQLGKKFWSTWTFQFKKFHNCTSSKNFIKTKLLKKSKDVNFCFYREIPALFRKYTFNIHFFVLNVHFFSSNVHFCIIQKSTYMKISIVKLIFLVQKQISEKHFQIFCCFVNTFLQVRIVCTNKCISEIPRIFCKNIIGCRESQCP